MVITGAGGMLGRDVVAAARARGHQVIALTHEDLDITSRDVDPVVSQLRPEAIINCAAWTDVDAAEERERDAMLINDTAAGLLAVAAAQVGAKIVHLSTDYVFDGSCRTPYVESDMPSPLSAYGRSKLAGETAVAVSNPNHFIVRSSWLFGLGGPNFVETMLRVGTEQQEVLVVSDQVGCPTYTPHLAGALVLLAEDDEYGIHHVTGEGACSWFDFAQEIFDLAGYDTRVMAATTDMLARPAPRPAHSVLGTERPNPIALPPWRKALAEYMRLRARIAATAGGAA
jgi:dTDP-4-dehydrorhamnose reductase